MRSPSRSSSPAVSATRSPTASPEASVYPLEASPVPTTAPSVIVQAPATVSSLSSMPSASQFVATSAAGPYGARTARSRLSCQAAQRLPNWSPVVVLCCVVMLLPILVLSADVADKSQGTQRDGVVLAK